MYKLNRRYADLEPLAAEVLKGARMLLIFAIIRLPSLEGLLGLLAAVSILFWAAPGSLGIAYSARQVHALLPPPSFASSPWWAPPSRGGCALNGPSLPLAGALRGWTGGVHRGHWYRRHCRLRLLRAPPPRAPRATARFEHAPRKHAHLKHAPSPALSCTFPNLGTPSGWPRCTFPSKCRGHCRNTLLRVLPCRRSRCAPR